MPTARKLFPKSTVAKTLVSLRPDRPAIPSHGTSRNNFFVKPNELARSSNNKAVSPLSTYGFQACGNAHGSLKTVSTPVYAPDSFNTTAGYTNSALKGAQFEYDDSLNRANCRGLDRFRNVPSIEETSMPDEASFSPDITQNRQKESFSNYRDDGRSLGATAIPDAYAAFSDDEDSTWSTLPHPKRPRIGHGGEKVSSGSVGIKQSGRFKLPLSFLPGSSTSDALIDTVQPKRRVVTYLPPPRRSPAAAQAGEHLGAQTSRTTPAIDRTVKVGKPVEKWKITRLGYNPGADTGNRGASGMRDCDQNGVCSLPADNSDKISAERMMATCESARSTLRSKSDGLDSDTSLPDLLSSDALSSDDAEFSVARYDIADTEDRYPDVRKAIVEVSSYK